MRLYEGMFILDDARCAEDYDGTVAIVHDILNRHDAEIVDSSKWDEGKLAYPIKRRSRGVYVLIHFNAAPEAIAPIRRRLHLADEVLREMIVVDEDGVSLGTEKEAEKAAREARRAERQKAEQEKARKAEQEAKKEETAEAEQAKEEPQQASPEAENEGQPAEEPESAAEENPEESQQESDEAVAEEEAEKPE